MRIESLLAARQFMAPQLAGGRLYFVSDISGRLSLYAMEARPGGSVPEPLLPPHIALQNPHHLDLLYVVFHSLGKILVMLDQDGDEHYQPMFIPLRGGFPELAFGDQLQDYNVNAGRPDLERGLAYFMAASRSEPRTIAYRGDLRAGTLEKIAESRWGRGPDGVSADHSRLILSENYTPGDNVLFLWQAGQERLLYGTPIEQREPGRAYPTPAIFDIHFLPGDQAALLVCALFADTYSLGCLRLDNPAEIQPVTLKGLQHTGMGELEHLEHLQANRFAVRFNIDGCSWLYEGEFDEAALTLALDRVICGTGETADGMLESGRYDPDSRAWALSFSTATSPAQLYTVGPAAARHTAEHVLGLPAERLSSGEDASFTSHDGLRISARLYRPAPALGFSGPRPLIYYIHGGPQSQERPDFTWFSMPLIQFLTLNGFAVFVPNVRGSSGYGLGYMKRVDHDWGGQDRLDHVHAMTQVLSRDPGLDLSRTGVTGRSYGGYMTLTLAARHPELWAAAVDMFGPYNLLTFIDRLPETWKPYFRIAVGDPEKDEDRAFLVERSPSTYMNQVVCPLLVIQGRNDPRVIEQESRDVVDDLRAQGKAAEILVFEDEGHDVLKFGNKVRCYNAMTDFFKQHLRP